MYFISHRLTAKLSSKDDKLFPHLKEILCYINPELEDKIHFSDQPLKHIDAIIATGSNNSSRYFEYYFGKYPHIIRKNRNSIAIITGGNRMRSLENWLMIFLFISDWGAGVFQKYLFLRIMILLNF